MNNSRDNSIETDIDSLIFDERINKDPHFNEPELFQVRHLQPTVDKLLHLARFGNLLTLVLGDRGCGKSYLLNSFVNSVDDDLILCHIDGQPLLSSEQLFQQLAESFDADSEIQTESELEQWLIDNAQTSSVRLLIIDNAETLSSELLETLCSLSAQQQQEDSPQIQIVLFANHDLNISLEQAASGLLSEEGIYIIDIPTLTDSEATEWIKYVMHNQGYVAEGVELDDLVMQGKGNLEDLRVIAEEYALQQLADDDYDDDESDEDSVSMMGYWFAGLTIIIISMLGAFFYQDDLSELLFSEDAPVQAEIVANPVNVSNINATEERPVAEADDQPRINEQNTESASDDSLQQQSTAESITKPVIEKLEAQNPSMGESETADNLTADVDANETIANDVQEEPLVLDTEAGIDQAVTEVDTSLTAAENTNTESEKSVIDSELNEPEVVKQQLPQVTEMEQQLLDSDPTKYVVQIIGLSNNTAIDQLLQDHSELELMYYRSLLNDKPWKIIVISGFNSYAEANAVRKSLPKSLAQYGPWIKTIAKVQSELRAAVKATQN